MNKDSFNGRILIDIIESAGYSIKHFIRKYNLSDRYLRDKIIKPFKILKLGKIVYKKGDSRTERLHTDKEAILNKLLAPSIQSKEGRKTIKIFEFLFSDKKITTTNLQRGTKLSWEKCINTIERLQKECFLIKEKVGKRIYYKKNQERFKNMFIKIPLALFGKQLKRDFKLKALPTEKQLDEAYKGLPAYLKKHKLI